MDRKKLIMHGTMQLCLMKHTVIKENYNFDIIIFGATQNYTETE